MLLLSIVVLSMVQVCIFMTCFSFLMMMSHACFPGSFGILSQRMLIILHVTSIKFSVWLLIDVKNVLSYIFPTSPAVNIIVVITIHQAGYIISSVLVSLGSTNVVVAYGIGATKNQKNIMKILTNGGIIFRARKHSCK